MAQGKVLSQGSVPFSWEEKPGISKFISPNCTNKTEQNAIIRSLQKSSSSYISGPSMITYGVKISPPPCSTAQPPSRSSSIKGLWGRQDDPFAAAMKECTRNTKNHGMPGEGKICTRTNGRNKKLIFSCRKSCDVKEDNLVNLPSNRPPLPRERRK